MNLWKKRKTEHNNVYDGHAQQKLVTPHIQDRWSQREKRNCEWKKQYLK